MAGSRVTWWHETEDGRRVGWMTSEEMAALLTAVWSKPKWRGELGKVAGITRSHVSRYADGRVPIPRDLALLVRLIYERHLEGKPLPELHAPWLPIGDGSKSRKPDDAHVAVDVKPGRKKEATTSTEEPQTAKRPIGLRAPGRKPLSPAQKLQQKRSEKAARRIKDDFDRV